MANRFDLEERTQRFALQVYEFVEDLPRCGRNQELSKQIFRSAGSVGANYIEANEGLGARDFLMHLRIARKEAKETRMWLGLLKCSESHLATRDSLSQEARELTLIFSSMIRKLEGRASSDEAPGQTQ